MNKADNDCLGYYFDNVDYLAQGQKGILESEIGVSTGYFSRTAGKSIPSADVLIKTAKFLNVSMDDLINVDFRARDKVYAAASMFYGMIKGHDITWNDFRDIGIAEDDYDYTQIEDNLYMIHNKKNDAVEFIEANTASEIYKIFKSERG